MLPVYHAQCSCRKVMFSWACVKNSVLGGCMLACTGADTLPLGRYPTSWSDTPLGRHLPWADTSLGRHPLGQTPARADTLPGQTLPGQTPPRQTPPGRDPMVRPLPWQTLPDSTLQRMVRILLECILVCEAKSVSKQDALIVITRSSKIVQWTETTQLAAVWSLEPQVELSVNPFRVLSPRVSLALVIDALT